nr:u-box domain-containing protein 12 [Quercus suber]
MTENKGLIGACGTISPLVLLLPNRSNRGKKYVLMTMYKHCSIEQNKERAVGADVVKLFIAGGGARIGDSGEGDGGVKEGRRQRVAVRRLNFLIRNKSNK